MLTVQYLGSERIAVRDVPRPCTPKRGVVVQVLASGICRSELPAYRGPRSTESNEGHEIAGRIVDTGHARHWQSGDRVGIHVAPGCVPVFIHAVVHPWNPAPV